MGRTKARSTAAPLAVEVYHPVDIPALTGLRAIAAGVVVVHHLRMLADVFAPHPAAVVARKLLDGGFLGVDVFFVLSGFVIAHTYAHRLAVPAAAGTVWSYLVARLARVYPVYLVTLVATVLMVLVNGVPAIDPDKDVHYSALALVGNVLMLQGLPGVYPWNYPSWSISCEFAAYLLFPLVAARLLRVRWVTALALATAVLCLQLLVLHRFGAAAQGVHIAFWARIAGEFTAGALLWVVWRRVLRPGRWGDAVVLLCGAGTAWLLLHGHSWLAVPLLAAKIPAAACATGPVRALLAHPVAQWGGRISYALYLVHSVVMGIVVWAMPDTRIPRSASSAIVYFVAVVIVSVAAAALLHHGVEEPARRWLRRRLAGTSTTASGARPERLHDDQAAPDLVEPTLIEPLPTRRAVASDPA